MERMWCPVILSCLTFYWKLHLNSVGKTVNTGKVFCWSEINKIKIRKLNIIMYWLSIKLKYIVQRKRKKEKKKQYTIQFEGYKISNPNYFGLKLAKYLIVRIMVFNVTFNNISLISWRLVLPEYSEKTTDRPQVTDQLYNIMLYRIHERDYNSQI